MDGGTAASPARGRRTRRKRDLIRHVLRWCREPRRVLLLWPGRKRAWWRPFRLVVLIAGLLLIGLTAFAIVSWANAGEGPFRIDGGCSNNQFGCGALIEIAATVLALGFASGVFVYWRVSRIVGEHARGWRDEPYRLVPTATPIEDVVGRDGICEIIEEDLADRTPRPQVIVGGVGDGKTAVLVRLAHRLVRRGAVPVAVRMRDAEMPLHFHALARKAFLERVQGPLFSDDEGDKVWRKLRKDGRIVVLADGLEEALIDNAARETAIRDALDEAEDDKLPVVVTSRPDESLARINAAVIRLEPLSARATIEYIDDDDSRSETDLDKLHDVRKLAEVAEIADKPLFLALMRDSYRTRDKNGRRSLDDIPRDRDTTRVDVQVKLLRQWADRLLVDGRYGRLSMAEREEALRGTETMACVALAENQLELDFDRFKTSPYVDADGDRPADPRKVARAAERLDLVEMTEGGMRFKHSIMQAYLGAQQLPERVGRRRHRARSRIVERVPAAQRVTGPDYLADALAHPSREVLMALVVCCKLHGSADVNSVSSASLRERLRRVAIERSHVHDPVAFDVLTAAYEIDAMLHGSGAVRLGDAGRLLWRNAARFRPSGELREAKVRAILRMAKAGAPHGYRALWDVCLAEHDYRVRFRAAQELAMGGDGALSAVEPASVLDACGPCLSGSMDGLDATEVRRGSVQGWMLPLLTRSSRRSTETAFAALEGWIRLTQNAAPDRQLHLGVESCLAQGFKLEANRIVEPSDTEGVKTRARLIALATSLLSSAQWWYSRMALVQAFGLWAIAAEGAQRKQLVEAIEDRSERDPHPFVRAAARLCLDAVRADGKARRKADGLAARRRVAGTASNRVRRWWSALRLRLAARPARRAAWRGPGRYIWIDEVGVTAKVGPRRSRREANSPTGFWISRDAGWRALAPRARQLVAEVLLLLNLVEDEAAGPATEDQHRANGRRPPSDEHIRVRDREKRRRRAAVDSLPRCIAHASERERLGVNALAADERPLGDERPLIGGCPEHCGLGVCPYPPLRRAPFRGDLSETFCREQVRLLSGHWKDLPGRWSRQGRLWRSVRRTKALPAWVEAPRVRPRKRRKARKDLEQFWGRMEERDQR